MTKPENSNPGRSKNGSRSTNHNAKVMRDYVKATKSKLELHFLPGYAPELDLDELVWNYMKRIGVTRRPLAAGEASMRR